VSVSGVSGASQNPLLQTLLDSMPQLQSGSSAAAASTGGASASYLLSLGSQQAQSAVLGYNQLGKLVNQAEDTLSGLGQSSTLSTAGGLAAQKFTVDVQQLAAAQSLSSGQYSDPDKTVVGTGTLTIQLGTVGSSGGAFTASGTPVTVSIADGTLNGIASAINNAKAGVTASVVQSSSGVYQLVIAGSTTGAANAFSLSGIAGLTYDPTAPSSGALSLTQAAQDAHYTVNGTAQTSATNENAPIASGVVSTLTAVGVTTVSVPYGQQQASAAAQNLTSSFNQLLSSISLLTASGGQLSADPSVAFTLVQSLGAAASQSFGGKTLADIGITAQSDGTLAIDQAKLQAAYAADPAGTNAVISGASAAITRTLQSAAGPSGAIDQETRALVAVMCQGPSLADYLLGGSGGSNTSSMLSALSSSSSGSSTPNLADYLLAMSNNSSSSSSDPLLSLGSTSG